MFDDIVKSIKADLYERVSSPLLSSFVISWAIWNYKFLMVIFSDLNVKDKFELIETKFTHTFWPDVCLFSFVYPLITSALYLFAYPFISKPVFEFVKKKQNEIINIDKKLKGERLLSVEESRKLKAQLSVLQSEYYQELSEKEEENSILKEEIKRLNDLSKVKKVNQLENENTKKSEAKVSQNNDEHKVLKLFADGQEEWAYRNVINELQGDMFEIEAKHQIDKTIENGLLRRIESSGSDHLLLTSKGRGYIVKNKLHLGDIPF